MNPTGAAVVLAAHISKGNINAKEVEQGFAVGSLAFENATRQMSGMITMPTEDAKKYGLEDTRKDYVRRTLILYKHRDEVRQNFGTSKDVMPALAGYTSTVFPWNGSIFKG